MNIKYYRDPIEYERKKGWSPSDLSFERAVSEAMKVLLSRGDVLGFRHSSCSFWHVFVNAWNRVSPDLLVSNLFHALRFPAYLIHLGASSDLIITTRSTLFPLSCTCESCQHALLTTSIWLENLTFIFPKGGSGLMREDPRAYLKVERRKSRILRRLASPRNTRTSLPNLDGLKKAIPLLKYSIALLPARGKGKSFYLDSSLTSL